MPAHKPINTAAGKQRRRNRSMAEEIDPRIIFIAESFLNIFNLSYNGQKRVKLRANLLKQSRMIRISSGFSYRSLLSCSRFTPIAVGGILRFQWLARSNK